MKEKDYSLFWVGFILSIGLVAWLYWWRKQQEAAAPPYLMSSPPRPSITPPPVVIQSKSPFPKPAAPDDLTQIKGIGPVFAQRLQEAGIYTFVALAQQTPARLREIVRRPTADAAGWIKEAQQHQAS